MRIIKSSCLFVFLCLLLLFGCTPNEPIKTEYTRPSPDRESSPDVITVCYPYSIF